MLLIQLFGPILADAFKRWLEKRLGVAETKLTPSQALHLADKPSGAKAIALLQIAHEDLPRWAVRKRFLIRRMIAAIDPGTDLPVALASHSAAELKDVQDLEREEGGE